MRKRAIAAAVLTTCVCLAPATRAVNYTWDPGSTHNSGGNGNWDTTTGNNVWYNGTDQLWPNTGTDVAVFGGTNGTVNVDGPVTALGLTFNTTNYTISGTSPLTLGSGSAAATIVIGSGMSETISAPVVIAGLSSGTAVGLQIANNSSLTINSSITSAATSSYIFALGGTLVSSTFGGTLTLNGAGSFTTGNVVLFRGGTLNLNNANALGTGNAVGGINFNTTLDGPNVLDNSSSTDITLATAKAWTVTTDFTFLGTHSLNLGATTWMLGTGTGAGETNVQKVLTVNASTFTVGGAIASTTAGLAKAGAGTLVLSGANTYTMGTTVTGGTLVAAYTAAGTGATSSTGAGSLVLNGGTLASKAGGASYIAGSVDASAGTNSVQPGGTSAIGTLKVGGSFTLGAGDTTTIDVSGATSDVIQLVGVVTLGGNLAINVLGAPTVTSYTVLTSGSAITTAFANVAPGGTLATADGSGTFTVEYGSSSSSIILDNFVAAAPEPGSLALVLTSAGLLCRRRRNVRSLHA